MVVYVVSGVMVLPSQEKGIFQCKTKYKTNDCFQQKKLLNSLNGHQII